MVINWQTLPALSEYSETVSLMEECVSKVILGEEKPLVMLVEHKPVYTAGTSAAATDILAESDIPVIYTGRGGKITYHGPGQRVIYPILDLKLPPFNRDLKKYVRFLENWIIKVLKAYNISGYCYNDSSMVGVWVNTEAGPRKIAAIGIRVKKWVSYHGVAINISTDLSNYKHIVPCGIRGFGVTSLAKLGVNTTLEEFDQYLINCFPEAILSV